MAYQPRTKDYSDDWDAFTNGLKSRTTLDLTYYVRNLVRAATRIEGEDDLANALFEKLTRRARLVNDELHTRKAYAVPKISMEQRKRTLDELNASIPAEAREGYAEPVVRDGARFDDPPIPTRPTPLVPNAGGTSSTLSTTETLEDEDEESTEEILSPYKRFKINFEQEEDK